MIPARQAATMCRRPPRISSRGSLFAGWSTYRRTGIAPTAVLGQVGDEAIHGLEPGRIENLAALMTRTYQIGPNEVFQMKGQGRWRDVQFAGDVASGEPCGSGLHEKSESRQARFVCQGIECLDGCIGVHEHTIQQTSNNSMNIEIMVTWS